MVRAIVLFLLLSACLAGRAPVMPLPFDAAALSGDDFQERKEATAALRLWAKQNRAEALEKLPVLLASARHPEVTSRLLQVIEEIYLDKEPGFLGIQFFLSPEPFEYGGKEVRGVSISRLVPQGPCELAGLKMEDVILALDGVTFPLNLTQRDVPDIVGSFPAGQVLTVTFSRKGEVRKLPVTMGKRPENLQSRALAEKRRREFQEWLEGELEKAKK